MAAPPHPVRTQQGLHAPLCSPKAPSLPSGAQATQGPERGQESQASPCPASSADG